MASEIDNLLNAGILAARAGNKAEARRLLEQVLEKEDTSERAWFALASVVDTPRERRICLENVIEINPNNQQARQALERLAQSMSADSSQVVSRPSATPKASTPSTTTDTTPPLNANKVPVRGNISKASQTAWRSQTRPPGPSIRINPVLIVVAVVSALLIGFGLILATTTPPPAPTPIPTRTLSVAQIAGTRNGRPTLTPASTEIPIVIPTQDNGPTWTPSATVQPKPSDTPTPTLPPVADYLIAFVGERSKANLPFLYTITADGKGEKALIAGTSKSFDPAWAPNGKKIAYVSTIGDSDLLFIANGDGTQPQAIFQAVGKHISTPSWSPDGSRLAFASDNTGNNEIYTIKTNGSEVTQITNNKKYDNLDPAWSPDGTQLACAIDVTGKKAYYQIYLLDLVNKTPPKRLTESQGRSYNPSWSPDGKQIAFATTRNGGSRIYVMRADGNDQQPLMLDPGTIENRSPSWSTDGNFILFTSNRNGGLFNLFLMTPSGQNIQQITNAPGSSYSGKFRPNTSR